MVGANGTVIADALPQDTPLPPPAPTAPAAPTAPPAGPPPYGAPGGVSPAGGYASGRPPTGAPAVRYTVGAGLFIGLLGAVLLAVSLFFVNWTDADGTKFTDLSGNLRKIKDPKFPSAGVHAYFLYASWLAFVLFALVVVLVVLAGIPVPHTGPGNRYWRIGAAVVAAAGAILHSMMLSYLFKGTGHAPGAGPVLGVVGWVVVLVGTVFGARRVVRPVGRAV